MNVDETLLYLSVCLSTVPFIRFCRPSLGQLPQIDIDIEVA